MFRNLMSTTDGIELTVLRLAAGVMILPHALQKVFGIWGGMGLAGIMSFFTTVAHMPVWLGYVVIATELLGGAALIVGLFARVAAFFLFCEMVCAVYLIHFQNGFFMNWEAKMPAGAEGFEFHILAVAILIAVMIRGAGAASVDQSTVEALIKTTKSTKTRGTSRKKLRGFVSFVVYWSAFTGERQ